MAKLAIIKRHYSEKKNEIVDLKKIVLFHIQSTDRNMQIITVNFFIAQKDNKIEWVRRVENVHLPCHRHGCAEDIIEHRTD